MYLLIRYPAGIIAEGVVLATGRNRMRVAVADLPDTLELKRSGARWFAAKGEPIEFDFLMSDHQQAVEAPLTKAIGAPMNTASSGD